jgi:glycosyltransferase involved in cell wall biosynthesis
VRRPAAAAPRPARGIHLNQSGCYRVVLIIGHVRIFEDAAYLARRRPSPRRLRGVIAISSAILEELRPFPQLKDIRMHRHYDAYLPSAQPLPAHVPQRVANRVACVGRVVPNKGPDALIEAAGWLKRNGDDVECWALRRRHRGNPVGRLRDRGPPLGSGSRVRRLAMGSTQCYTLLGRTVA